MKTDVPSDRPRVAEVASAFTLIEIMIVVAIMGVILAMGLPPLLQTMRPQAVRKAAMDLKEVCNNARARAILSGTTAEIFFHPKERRFEVAGASSAGIGAPAPVAIHPSGGSVSSGVTAPNNSTSGQLPEDVKFEMLDVNLREYKEEDEAHVRFFPNGTSDEMTVVLVSDKNERRAVTLEITTGLADIETDMDRLMKK